MKNNLPPSDLLTYQETAAFLHISEASIRRLMQNDPTFPSPMKLSIRLVRFDKAKLQEWLELKSECA
jgi:predicted DNA-binding transcriptional regulator AlpA